MWPWLARLWQGKGPTKPEKLVQSRRRFLRLTALAAYGGGMGLLWQAWYAKQPRTAFHTFDDLAEWQQMDKLGHAYATYHTARATTAMCQWAALPLPQWQGAAAAFASLSGIEVFDGFAPAYGASLSDLAANALGALGFAAQFSRCAPNTPPWIKPKFSFAPSGLAPLRPQVLGRHLAEQVLKDYNGQSYWLSVSPGVLLGRLPQPWAQQAAARWPAWLHLSIGHGIEGMVYGRQAPNLQAGYLPRRQFYLAPDLDLAYLQQKSIPDWAKFLLFWVEMWRLPLPAYRINGR